MLNPCRTRLTLSLLAALLASTAALPASTVPTRARAVDPADPASGPAVSGTVTDPSGAKVAKATVHIQTAMSAGSAPPQELSRDLTTGTDGRFTLSLPPGRYDVTIVAAGFEPYIATVTLTAKSPSATLNAKLAILSAAETVTVASDPAQLSTASDANKSALVFNGKSLDTFSSDDDTFQQQILALAGGSDPSSPPQIFVDGFSNGRFPPKTSIREIRINQNPYSAQYDSLGFGRVEIFTKPGSDNFHGGFNLNGNSSAFNSRNPYAGAEPAYHLLNFDGYLGGPLGKKMSFFTNATYRDQQGNAVVNATTGLDASGNPVQTVQAVPNPQTSQTYSVRLDRQVTATNTATGRFEFNRNVQTNAGVGQLVLASQGVNSTANTDTLQLSDTQVIGAKMVSETRFQFAHTSFDQSSVSSAPTIVVQGAFNGGGSNTQSSNDAQNRGELTEYLSRQQGPHFLRMGGRYRFSHETNASRANFNGQFIFPSIQAYLKAVANPAGGGATQFNLTTGQPSASLLLQDFDLYAEDEWKLRQNLTLNFGFRLEGQSSIPDHVDPAPRFGIAWAVGQTDKKPAIVLLRSGGAIFYDRFSGSNLLTTLHQNGVAETSYIVTNPGFYCTTLTASCPSASSLSAQTPTIYTTRPNLHAQYSIITGLSAERDLWKKGSITVNYIYARGVHQYNSANVNAPLPGTYNPAVPGSGVRPLGGTQNIYQFQSNGIANNNRIFANLNLEPVKGLSIWVFAVARLQRTDSSGAGSFPSSSYDLAADYGRPSQPTSRVYTGGHYDLPLGFNLNYFASAYSGAPFNITTGTDLNGDTQYNDRPAFATDLTRPSVVKTRYGNFDTAPIAGQTILPINYATGPAFVDFDLGAGKNFKFGPRPPAPPPAAGAPAPTGPVARPDPRYSVDLSIEAQNVLNHPNPGAPVGVLTSPEFGESISLNSPFSSNNAANRLLYLRASFNF
jgi:hypothetical protein